jgi:hypothetical protein
MKTRLRYLMTAMARMAAAVLILSNAAQLGAGVFCVGSDGHVDIESSVCACCTPAVPHDDQVESGLAPASPSCSDCVDVPLRRVPLKAEDTRFFPPLINTEGSPFALIWAGGGRTVPVVLGHPMDQHWQSLSSLSTVILLT